MTTKALTYPSAVALASYNGEPLDLGDGVMMAAPTGVAKAGDLSMSQIGRQWLAGVDATTAQALVEPTKPFQQSLWVYKCVGKIMSAASGVPLRLMHDAAGVKVNRKSHAVSIRKTEGRSLRALHGRKGVCTGKATDGEMIEAGEAWELLNKPNDYQDWPAFFAATVGYLKLRGKVAWALTDMVGNKPRQMHVLDGSQVKPQWSKGDGGMPLLLGYIYRPPGTGREIPFAPEEMKYFASWDDSDDPLGGMSATKAGRFAIATDYAASLYNAAMFGNSCEPGLAILFDDMLEDDQLEDFRQKLRQRHAGPANAKRELILGGAKDVKTLASSMRDLQFDQGKKTTRLEICCLLDVPPAVAGWVDAAGDSSAYTDNAQQQFHTDNIFPLLDGFLPAIQEIVERFDARAVAWFDVDDHPVVQKMRLSRTTAAKDYAALGYPLNSINELLDLGMPEVDYGDVGFLPMNLVPADQLATGRVGPAVDEGGGETDDELGQPSDASARIAEAYELKVPGMTAGAPDGQWKALADRLWEAWHRSWLPLARRVEASLRVRYQKQQKALAAALKRALPLAAEDGGNGDGKGVAEGDMEKDEGIVGRVLVEVFNDDDAVAFRQRVRAFVADANELGVRQALTEAGFEGEQLDNALRALLENPAITAAIQSDAVRISTSIDSYTRSVLRRDLAEGLAAGETIRTLADRVQTVMGNRRKAAMSVARNAVGQTLSRARHESQKSAGMTHKFWLHSRGGGERRPAHVAAESFYRANPIPLTQPFVINGVSLMYPRDHSAGAPAETVNCQCLQIASRQTDRRRAAFGPADLRSMLAKGIPGYADMLAARNSAAGEAADGAHGGNIVYDTSIGSQAGKEQQDG